DAETATGLPPLTNDEVADVVKKYPRQFVGFACVDPWKGKLAVEEMERAITGAHPAWPWHDEMLAIIGHKSNVFMDLSGWSPKYVPKAILDEAKGRLQDRILFGSDYPFIMPQRWLADFDSLEGFSPEVRQKILHDNAAKILNLKIG